MSLPTHKIEWQLSILKESMIANTKIMRWKYQIYLVSHRMTHRHRHIHTQHQKARYRGDEEGAITII